MIKHGKPQRSVWLLLDRLEVLLLDHVADEFSGRILSSAEWNAFKEQLPGSGPHNQSVRAKDQIQRLGQNRHQRRRVLVGKGQNPLKSNAPELTFANNSLLDSCSCEIERHFQLVHKSRKM